MSLLDSRTKLLLHSLRIPVTDWRQRIWLPHEGLERNIIAARTKLLDSGLPMISVFEALIFDGDAVLQPRSYVFMPLLDREGQPHKYLWAFHSPERPSKIEHCASFYYYRADESFFGDMRKIYGL